MKRLLDGLKRYEDGTKASYAERFALLAKGQKPETLFVTCADSRIVPSILATAEPGELFIVRNVANLVPANAPNVDPSVAAAVSYAVQVLGVEDIVVCGHSSCGGMGALLAGGTDCPHLAGWLAHGKSALDALRERGPLDPSRPAHDQLSQVGTLVQLDNLRSYPFVSERVAKGQLRLHAWWFDIAAGELLAYSDEHARYVRAVDALARAASPARRAG